MNQRSNSEDFVIIDITENQRIIVGHETNGFVPIRVEHRGAFEPWSFAMTLDVQSVRYLVAALRAAIGESELTPDVYRGFIEWLKQASLTDIATVLETMSVRLAALSPSTEIAVRLAAATARQETR